MFSVPRFYPYIPLFRAGTFWRRGRDIRVCCTESVLLESAPEVSKMFPDTNTLAPRRPCPETASYLRLHCELQAHRVPPLKGLRQFWAKVYDVKTQQSPKSAPEGCMRPASEAYEGACVFVRIPRHRRLKSESRDCSGISVLPTALFCGPRSKDPVP